MGGGASKNDFFVPGQEAQAISPANEEAPTTKNDDPGMCADKQFRRRAVCGWSCLMITILLMALLIPRIPTSYVDRAKAAKTMKFELLPENQIRIYGPLEMEMTNNNFYWIEIKDFDVVTTVLEDVESEAKIDKLRMNARSTTVFTLDLNQTLTISSALGLKAIAECIDNSMPVRIVGTATVRVPAISMKLKLDDTFETVCI